MILKTWILGFALLILVHIANAAEESPCPAQFETNVKCVLDLVGSADAKLIENRTLTAFHSTCAPDYPLDCFSEFDAAKNCYVETKGLLDTPGPLKRQKDAAYAAADACFGEKPVAGFLSGLEDIFLPSPIKLLSSSIGKKLWGSGDGSRKGVLPPPIAAVILNGLNATTPSPSPTPAVEPPVGSGDNATADGSDDDDEKKLFGRKECSPKPNQVVCVFKQLNKLSDSDPEFKAAVTTLKDGAANCKKVLQARCSPSTQEESQCVMQAHLPLILGFVDNILACMKDKGFTLPPMLPKNFPGLGKGPKLFP